MTLAQSAVIASKSSPYGEVMLWGSLLIIAIVILGAGVFMLRRRLTDDPATGPDEDEWSLQTLREMRKSGQISESEFQMLRARFISQFSAGSAESPADAEPGDVTSRE